MARARTRSQPALSGPFFLHHVGGRGGSPGPSGIASGGRSGHPGELGPDVPSDIHALARIEAWGGGRVQVTKVEKTGQRVVPRPFTGAIDAGAAGEVAPTRCGSSVLGAPEASGSARIGTISTDLAPFGEIIRNSWHARVRGPNLRDRPHSFYTTLRGAGGRPDRPGAPRGAAVVTRASSVPRYLLKTTFCPHRSVGVRV